MSTVRVAPGAIGDVGVMYAAHGSGVLFQHEPICPVQLVMA